MGNTITGHVCEHLAGPCTSVHPWIEGWCQLFLVPQVVPCHWPLCPVPQESGAAGRGRTAHLLLTDKDTTSQQITQLM